jgi:microcystin degradation protein MlrC
MRIALGQIWQGTNTFNPIRTTRQDFEALAFPAATKCCG